MNFKIKSLDHFLPSFLSKKTQNFSPLIKRVLAGVSPFFWFWSRSLFTLNSSKKGFVQAFIGSSIISCSSGLVFRIALVLRFLLTFLIGELLKIKLWIVIVISFCIFSLNSTCSNNLLKLKHEAFSFKSKVQIIPSLHEDRFT